MDADSDVSLQRIKARPIQAGCDDEAASSAVEEEIVLLLASGEVGRPVDV